MYRFLRTLLPRSDCRSLLQAGEFGLICTKGSVKQNVTDVGVSCGAADYLSLCKANVDLMLGFLRWATYLSLPYTCVTILTS